MIFRTPPPDFQKRFDIVSCFIEYNGEILLLKRREHKPQGGTWGLPAGKVGTDESLEEAIVREVGEEIGFDLQKESLDQVGIVYVRHHGYDFPYHMYRQKVSQRPDIELNLKEHSEFQWITPEKALELLLIDDEDECIKMAYTLD